MNFNISIEQEEEINQWLDEENKIAIENQLNSDSFDEETKNRLKESVEMGVEVPLHSLEHGYWSISFTPTAIGNRVYVHHHINGSSAKVQDYDDLREKQEIVTDDEKNNDEEKLTVSFSSEEPITMNAEQINKLLHNNDFSLIEESYDIT